jgi:subtilisin family serine protease
MKGLYMTDWGAKIKSACAGIAVAAIVGQTLAFGVSAQNLKQVKGTLAQMEERKAQPTEPTEPAEPQNPDSKLSPDMLEAVEGLYSTDGNDPIQKVIIQIQPSTKLNDMTGDTSTAETAQLFAIETRENRIKSAGLRDTLAELRGTLKRTFNNLGLISAELPLSQIRDLAKSGDVAYISLDQKVESFGHLMQTLGMYNSGVYVKSGTDYRDATGIGIAIIDSGIYTAHELFKKGGAASRVVANVDFTGQGRTDDPYGHGTHVASLAAGDWYANGGAYEAPASEANLINLRALKDDGTGTVSSVVAALDWAIANKTAYNIKVINMSLGVMAKDSYRNDPLCLAARRAFNAGMVVVASAGNVGKDANGNKIYGSINSPGIEPTVLTVGAIDTKATDLRSDDGVATYSSRGPTRSYQLVSGVKKYDNNIKPDLVAPGNKLIGARAPLNKLLALNPLLAVGNVLLPDNKKLMTMSGTSMAAPIVAGSAAVLLDTNPNLTPNMVKAILMYTAQAIYGYNTLEQGAGEINLDGAVRVAKLFKTTMPTANGSSLLTSSLPNPQRSTIAGQNIYWTKGVVTNRLMLTGDDLMVKYQGMYANGTMMGDSVTASGATIIRSGLLTSGSLSMCGGAVMGDGGIVMGDGGVMMGDSLIYLHGSVMGDGGIMMGDGMLMGDGIMMGDGTMMGDSVLIADSWALNAMSGDAGAGMPAEDAIRAR